MASVLRRLIFGSALQALLLLLFPIPAPLHAAGTGGARGMVRIESAPAEGAVVYLRDLNPQPAPVSPGEKTIVQEETEFRPKFTVATVGSTLLFENHDQETHNVKSDSPGNRFDVGAHQPGEIKKTALKKPGVVALRCKIHFEMRGTVFVSPSSFFAVADKDGKFEIAQVPSGSYRIEVWSPRLTAGEVEKGGRPLQVGPAVETLTLDLRAKAPAGADLSGISEQDWSPTVQALQAALDEAIQRWKKGARTGATTKAMTAYSRLYVESGLRDAIAARLGKAQAEAHDRRFNALIKGLQREGASPENEGALREEKEALLAGLRKNVRALHSP